MYLKALIIILFSVTTFSSVAQQGSSPCQKAKQLIEILNNQHIKPPAITDEWSERVFVEFFNLIDPARYYFSEADLAIFDLEKKEIDNSIADNTCKLIGKAEILINKRLKETSQLISSVLKNPLNYSETGYFTTDIKSVNSWPAKTVDVENKWRMWLKLQVLLWMSRQNAGKFDNLPTEEFKKLEAKARLSIEKSEQGSINRLLNPPEGLSTWIETIFLKAISHSYDPHTEFFTQTQKKDFDTSLSASGLSFGLEFEEDQFGQIKIARIAPGSAAWESNELNQGDLLLSVVWPNQKPIDISQYTIEELLNDFQLSERNEVNLTIKKLTGQLKSISLIKTKIELDENVIKGYVLKGAKNVGYISLPGFYSELEDQSNKGCADDIARELIKLKKEKIEGLILDLRFNGGGSLLEAIQLAGIFIDAGALALMQETGQPIVTLKDINRGTIYDGPLVIMVNGFSASASELVAAVLQDLNRAIIVGKTTYGKATGQIVVPVSDENQSSIKVTSDRIYRVTGKSLQRKGVTPDIVIPDALDAVLMREQDFRNSLSADSVTKKAYYSALPVLPINDLKVKSTNRINSSERFKQVQQASSILSKSIPLKLSDFAMYTRELEIVEKSHTVTTTYSVQNLQYDNTLLALDSHRKEVSSQVLEEIQRSPYIEEAYNIIMDFLLINRTK